MQQIINPNTCNLPIGGKIRPGIKVLTKATSENQQAVQIYQEMEDAGESYDDIESYISNACKIGKCMTPKNVPYFKVHRKDFALTGAADRIMQLYGSDGQFGYQLYSFPVIFPFDDLFQCLPHGFELWSASEKINWSEASANGVIKCMTRAEAIQTDGNRRGRKQYGGRPINEVGDCDPNLCDYYGKGACKLTGAFRFYIPGIPGAGIIELPHTSFYALQRAISVLGLVKDLAGHLRGTHGGKPFFQISKMEDEVSRINIQTGKAQRTKQFITTVASDIDVGAMFIAADVSTQVPMLDAPTQAPMLNAPYQTKLYQQEVQSYQPESQSYHQGASHQYRQEAPPQYRQEAPHQYRQEAPPQYRQEAPPPQQQYQHEQHQTSSASPQGPTQLEAQPDPLPQPVEDDLAGNIEKLRQIIRAKALNAVTYAANVKDRFEKEQKRNDLDWTKDNAFIVCLIQELEK